jgi:hypothetical protein
VAGHDRQEIDFPKIEIAGSLFNQGHKVNLWDSFKRLDHNKAKLAIAAICNFARSHGLENPIWSNATRRQKGNSRGR